MIAQGDFDTQAITRLRGLGGDALVRRIAALFLEFAAAKVNEAVAGGEAGDLPEVAAAAHAIRSSAANIGAMTLLAIATELEVAARAGRADLMPALLSRLRVAYDDARLHVLEFIPGGMS